MKKLSLMMFLSLFVVSLSAQKSAVKQAKSAMSNTAEARELIKPALTNPETSQDPETWKIAGDIEYKAFDKERDAEMTKEMTGKGGNLELMYDGIYNMVEPYLKADELAEKPDAKGKIKNKVRKDIVKNLKTAFPFYVNAGIYYNNEGQKARQANDKMTAIEKYKKATDFFEMYWNIPSIEFMKDEKLVEADSTFQIFKYYTIISAIQSDNKKRSVDLLNRLLETPYVANSIYEETAPYELLCVQYQELGDSVNYVKALRVGADKFPKSQYFTPNLINEYIKGGDVKAALDYIDLAVKNDPTASCELLGLKGSLLVNEGKFDEGQKVYEEVLATDPDCLKGLEGLGVLYGKRAEASKEQVAHTTNRQELAQIDKNTIEFYTKSLPYLEKFCVLLEAQEGVDQYDVERAYKNLENIYYNLILLNVDKNADLERVQKKTGK